MRSAFTLLPHRVPNGGRAVAVLATLLGLVRCSSEPARVTTTDASAAGATATGGQAAGTGGANVGGASGSVTQGGGGGTPGGTGGRLGGGGSSPRTDASVGPGVDSGSPGTPYVYVSGYGANITEFSFDRATAQLTNASPTGGGTSPSYLAIAPDKRHLYAINEAGAPNSKVIAFSIDSTNGHLSEIDRQDTGGSGAPHLAVHPSGRWIAVAHYTSGHTSILPIAGDGTLGAPTDVKKGPGDTCGKAHQAVFDSTGTHLFVPCLESNYVIHYLFANGVLTYATPDTVAVAGGPRHLALDPSERHVYVLSETESTITSFSYDKTTGTLSDPQTIQSYEQTKGSSAHILVHPGGKWLYASNRTENSIGLFSIDAGGRPHAVGFEKTGISTPRDFSVDTTGAFLISANQNGDQSALVFRVSSQDGTLTRTQAASVGGNPTFTTTVYLP